MGAGAVAGLAWMIRRARGIRSSTRPVVVAASPIAVDLITEVNAMKHRPSILASLPLAMLGVSLALVGSTPALAATGGVSVLADDPEPEELEEPDAGAPPKIGDYLPQIEAEVERTLGPGVVLQTLGSAADAESGEGDSSDGSDEAGASAAAFDEPKPKPGTVGELVKAVSKDPVVQAKLDTIGKLVIEKVKSEWAGISRGEVPPALTFLVPIAAGVVTGVIADPGARKLVQDVLNGPVSSAVADATNLKVNFDITSRNPSVTVLYDFAPMLRKMGVPGI
jgi:hypothetical protein